MEQTSQPKEKNTGMAVLAYIVFFIPLLTDAKNDPFVKYHVKQGIVLFVAGIIAGFITWVPIVGWAFGIFVFIVWLIGIMNAVNGQQKPLPLIGGFAEKFKI